MKREEETRRRVGIRDEAVEGDSVGNRQGERTATRGELLGRGVERPTFQRRRTCWRATVAVHGARVVFSRSAPGGVYGRDNLLSGAGPEPQEPGSSVRGRVKLGVTSARKQLAFGLHATRLDTRWHGLRFWHSWFWQQSTVWPGRGEVL